jgi:ABC-type multidrug transport system fused ATPase/permease subunit
LRRFIRLYIINTFFTLLWFTSPILVTVMSFTSYTKLEHKQLSSSVAFTSMAIFLILRGPLNILPNSITELLETIVSMRRIEAFLNEGEIWKYSNTVKEATPESIAQSPMSFSQPAQVTNTIGFTNATFKWHTKATADASNTLTPSQGAFMLKNLTLSFPIGKLSLICMYYSSNIVFFCVTLVRSFYLHFLFHT